VAISADERALTTVPSPAAANCLAASMALPATAMAALKYLSDGASGRVAPIHSVDCAGMTIWTTQPAGGALSDMVRTSDRACPTSALPLRRKHTDPLARHIGQPLSEGSSQIEALLAGREFYAHFGWIFRSVPG